MIDLYRFDMERVGLCDIAKGAAEYLDELLAGMDDFLRTLCDGTPLWQWLEFDHLGFLAPLATEGELAECCHSLEFEITRRFPSKVVAAYVRRMCARPDLEVQITTAASRGNGRKVIEIFSAVPGLSPDQFGRLAPDIFHLAFRPAGAISLDMVIRALPACGFSYVMGGSNPYDMRSAAGASQSGVTLLYFVKQTAAFGRLKVEIVVPDQGAVRR